MKAVRIAEFGGPEVMKVEEFPMPVPADDEILLKVYATSVNPADYVVRQGGNDLLRPLLKLPQGLGLDAAGVVETVGSAVTRFKKGDKVFGVPNMLTGSYAAYIAAKADQFALMPHRATFNEAGAIPSCAAIAWSGIVEEADVQPGQRVLVHGAAGGVGVLALQFAKARGAYVIGTASAHNTAFLEELGADEVIDYQRQAFETILRDVDVVFNASPVRDEALRIKSATVLKEGGIFVCTHIDQPFAEDFLQTLAQHKVRGAFIRGMDLAYSKRLEQVAALIDAGKVRVVISKVYPLEAVADAHRESETKHVRGKLVLEIRKENQ